MDAERSTDTRTVSDRLAYAREAAGYSSPRAAAKAFEWNENTYKSHENGLRQSTGLKEEHARKYARAFGVSLSWLMTGRGDIKGKAGNDLVRVIGQVGADASGSVVMTTAHDSWDMAPPAPGATTRSVALEVRGHSMHTFAEDGSLIYFEDQQTPPSPDLIDVVCAVETEDGRVLVKRLRRGSAPDLYDLESIVGPKITDVRLVWAAEIIAVVPPRQARRIIMRATDAA